MCTLLDGSGDTLTKATGREGCNTFRNHPRFKVWNKVQTLPGYRTSYKHIQAGEECNPDISFQVGIGGYDKLKLVYLN